MERPFPECQLGIGDWESLPPELVAQIYTHLPLRERKLGRKICKGWKRGLDTMVSKLRVGPHNREPNVWNRQLLMMKRLQHLFPCLQEIDFDQGVGSDLLVRDPGLPHNLNIIPRVSRIGVTSSRTALHLAAVHALAARPEVASFSLSLPSPITNADLCELLSVLGPKLTSLEVQQAHELSSAALKGLAASSRLGALSLEGIPRMGKEGWRALSSLTALTRLAISTLTRLQDLRLKVREIDADGVAALQTLRDLRSLDLEVWVSPVRPRVIEALLSFTRLEAVRLEAYSSLETARCFCALRHLPRLAHLDLRLSGSSFALDDNLEALASLSACSKLASLSLAAPAPALSALSACSGIQKLRLSDASMLSNRITGTELPRLPELRHLNLLHCSALTDAGLAAVAAQYPVLTGLQLKSGSLSDAGLTAIATLTSLERLDLVDCEALKGEGLRAILASLPYLQAVTITGNDTALEEARIITRTTSPHVEVAKGRYPFELESSLRPLQDRIYS
ncbi:RNI-like protein [Coccomyxa subellipsoidea C-169]|uniref:RNI-like protein n=1 Tax=Coccomyxa subellipsoidea (strain C-169) TaxID=574566 RepID=I0YV70_COCSC|nr:RNI-like protein [Coccomyxa subellipsoidea C-169]EIE22289.1 RNI-like protein [Coccomyxa subellipsoidea C-169]|eukprot:XP_005646833.1 RNI-like protein [Coccomyxa subellipsoidea C-169]